MINNKRLEDTFISLVRIPGLSQREGRIAQEVIKRLKRVGALVKQDRGMLKLGYETGNIIARVPGQPGLPPLMLCAHLDTVGPAEKIAFRKKGSVIESTGHSILGADCRSGIAAILEVLAHLKEERLPHPPLEIVFTVGEEIGLVGAKNLEYKMLKAKHGVVLDSTNPAEIVTAAPAAYRMNFTIIGREAHAGVNPEQGVNAILVAAKAIAAMKLGRINKNTTANIGTIEGGRATNIVPPRVSVAGEARSHDPARLERQVAHMRACIKEAVKSSCKKIPGLGVFPRLEENVRLEYPAMKVNPRGRLVQAVRRAGREIGLEIKVKAGGGGSDANIFNARGIESVILGTGMDRVHTTQERIDLKDLEQCTRLLAGSIKQFHLPSREKN